MVHLDALPHGLCRVVASVDKPRPQFRVVGWWVELEVVDLARLGVASAPDAPLHQDRVGHVQQHKVRRGDACRLQSLRLHARPRKAIQQPALVLAILLRKAGLDDADDEVVRNQRAIVHAFFRFDAERCVGGNLCAQSIARRYMYNTIFLDNELALCAFTGCWSSSDYDFLHWHSNGRWSNLSQQSEKKNVPE